MPPIPTHCLVPAGYTDSDDYSIEAKLVSDPDKRLRWLIGLYGYSLAQNNYALNFVAPTVSTTGVVLSYTSLNKTANSAIFGRVSFDITEQLVIDIEGRQARESRLTQDFTSTPTGIRNGFSYSDIRSFDSFTPRVTLSYKPNDNMTFYGIYSQGTKPGGLNGNLGLANGFPAFEEESSTNYEIGAKARLFDGRGTVALSAYTTEANDMQLTTAVAGSQGVLTSIVTNQGNAEISGLEGEFRFQLSENLGIGFTASLVNAEFTAGCDEFEYTLQSGGFQIGSTCTTTRR
ncbi:MAG: TonB-dependent receptor [Hyphomonadaceae bacterium]|nr:TonB-dependent receptor [Hyphomonadaceae bacterium]